MYTAAYIYRGLCIPRPMYTAACIHSGPCIPQPVYTAAYINRGLCIRSLYIPQPILYHGLYISYFGQLESTSVLLWA